MPAGLDIKGKRFGRLLVLERANIPGARNAMWRCQCDCGNETITAAANIGKTTLSCGCLAKETARELLTGNTYQRTHNLSHTVEHNTWLKIQERCSNPNTPKYHRYGGRGICVCQRWLDDFMNFYNDMGLRPSPKHSIDRINNDGNYEPSNCRWALPRPQTLNSTTPMFIEIDGVTLCITDWCESLGVPRWKPAEMVRKRGSKRNLPPEFTCIKDAVRELYRRHHTKPSAGC